MINILTCRRSFPPEFEMTNFASFINKTTLGPTYLSVLLSTDLVLAKFDLARLGLYWSFGVGIIS